MKSLISQLLFDPVQQPVKPGRQVRFDEDDVDIMASTGPMDERITTMMRTRGYPMTAREIATRIGSNPSRVTKGLHVLVESGHVEVIDIPGSVREYMLL